MEVFRIAKRKYIRDLQGTGARLYGGRWNSKGVSVLYTAESRSLAALEALIHIPQKNMTTTTAFAIMRLALPETLKVKTLLPKNLPADWKQIPPSPSLQKIGHSWLNEGKFPILKVPSVVIPEEFNYLLNPLHPHCSNLKIKEVKDFVFDERIITSS